MISAGEFRNGVTFDMDGKVMQVVEFQHVKPGNWIFAYSNYFELPSRKS